MEVILKHDIQGLGYKNDTVEVKPGYGRNYLIPQGFAIIANETNKKVIRENVRQASHKAAKLKTDAEEIAARMEGVVLEIGAKAGESGKIFGAVTAIQIADALRNKGFEIDRKKISFSPIKQIGDYRATIDLHREVKYEIAITIFAE